MIETLTEPGPANNSRQPLAYRMAPRKLDEYIGQEHILSKGKMLRRMIEADRLSSIILFGPPGTGKTSLARVIAAQTEAGFKKLNAVTSGVADIKRIIADTTNLLLNPSGKTVLFIDEIHRFNKAQQDALLPHVEDGTLILIGATTENPFFEVNKALISRSTVFQLHPLNEEHILQVLKNALTDSERGLGGYDVRLADEAAAYISNLANGDARIALNALELAVTTTPPNGDGQIFVDRSVVEDCMQKRSISFDKNGEGHYDNISAFIKSMRGSDPDAAVFYLARALHGGEDIEFLARRILICAAEDVGLANPQMLSIALSAYQGVTMIGMPEARILLSEAAIAVATSPKSNAAYVAVDAALSDVESRRTGEVPMHLRNAPAAGMAELGYKQGYKYAHDYEGNIVDQEYLPADIAGTKYYNPTSNGYEARIKEWLDRRREKGSET
ncbi:MAG: replication-associated recombination protein A [Eubacteriales bacterium]|nr:replication-associated recombination protein A [Eubacteriales bacterium]MDD4681630.1 replication-associated recombination protein A [Eubacteriales bacterium]